MKYENPPTGYLYIGYQQTQTLSMPTCLTEKDLPNAFDIHSSKHIDGCFIGIRLRRETHKKHGASLREYILLSPTRLKYTPSYKQLRDMFENA